MSSNRVRDLAGFAFFAFAALVSGVAAMGHPNLLAWLYTFHNLLLAWFYVRRQPAERYDRQGLWLGLVAALLPVIPYSDGAPKYILIPGLAGYGLCLWTLVVLGPRFGIAPADRGLTMLGPYRFIRHPMYLGELVFRVALVFSSRNILLTLLVVCLLAGIQIWRISREEKVIDGYSCYTRFVHWRLVPGIW